VSLFTIILFLHVLGAIIAFGPTFSFPIIGRMGGAERMHANFATRLSLKLSHNQVTPLAIFQGITGVALIVVGNVDLLKSAWLLVAIVLYLIALGYAIFVQTPTVERVIAMTGGHPVPGAAPAGPPAGGPPAGGPPAGGPPPELMATIKRVQRGGMFLAALIVAIVFLMVTKPF
jgi:uncharacterized membrane protein